MAARGPAVRAPELGGHCGGDLMGDQGVLYRGQEVFGLAQLQTQGVGREGFLPLHGEHLAYDGLGVVVGV